MQTDTEAVVKIEWNETCLQHGDPKVTKHVLKKSKWNLTVKDTWKTNGRGSGGKNDIFSNCPYDKSEYSDPLIYIPI